MTYYDDMELPCGCRHHCKGHAQESKPTTTDDLLKQAEELSNRLLRHYGAGDAHLVRHLIAKVREREGWVLVPVELLDACKTKLQVYRSHSTGEYRGGMEHRALIMWLEEYGQKAMISASKEKP